MLQEFHSNSDQNQLCLKNMPITFILLHTIGCQKNLMLVSLSYFISFLCTQSFKLRAKNRNDQLTIQDSRFLPTVQICSWEVAAQIWITFPSPLASRQDHVTRQQDMSKNLYVSLLVRGGYLCSIYSPPMIILKAGTEDNGILSGRSLGP